MYKILGVVENNSGEGTGFSSIHNRILFMTMRVLCLDDGTMFCCANAVAIMRLLEILPKEMEVRRGRKKGSERRRREINYSPSNFNGPFTLVK
jgi:hypothetical protein